ncbi:Regulator_of chromosome condensation (RCC1) repeat-containing protein [Hexamita inflata]|uniref:Regulator_of chromosome condensation (RCC1) repeat-containing protein n=1 Tax=Hexamita inflata TaxID=28002 RepID=A0ABP1IK45_9EUKA
MNILVNILSERVYFIGKNPFDVFALESADTFQQLTITQKIAKHKTYGGNTLFLDGSDHSMTAYGSSLFYELGTSEQVTLDSISRSSFFLNSQVKMFSLGADHSMVLLTDDRLYWQGKQTHPGYKEYRPSLIHYRVSDGGTIPDSETIISIGSCQEADYIQTNTALYFFRFCDVGLCGFDYTSAPAEISGNQTQPVKFQFPPSLKLAKVFFYDTFIIIQDTYGYNHVSGNFPCFQYYSNVRYLPNFYFTHLTTNPQKTSVFYVLKNGTFGGCGADFRFSTSTVRQFQIPGTRGTVIDIGAGSNGWYVLTENYFYVYGSLEVNGKTLVTKYGWHPVKRVKGMNQIVVNDKWIILYNSTGATGGDTVKTDTSTVDKVTLYVVLFGVLPIMGLVCLILWVVSNCEDKYKEIKKNAKND